MRVELPLVSVLMTAYNREQFITSAIKSVLKSTYEQFELIIVDDCSSDMTFEIAKDFEAKDKRVKVYRNETNLGDYPNRNKAASYANGKYIKYLDSDDLMYPHCLQVMVDGMIQFPDAGYGLSSIGDPLHSYPISISPHDTYIEHFYGFGHFGRAPGSSIIKKSAFEFIGGFKSKKYVGDTELWFLLSQKFNLVKLPRDLVWDRIHLNAEKVYEKRNKGVEAIRKKMVVNFLQHPDCPLNKREIENIFKSVKRKTIKETIRKWL
jgi:glycosyltransferase involved in cell wall biosynthesis